MRGLWAGAAPTIMRNGTNQMCLFWAKNNFDRLLWGKEVRFRPSQPKSLQPALP